MGAGKSSVGSGVAERLGWRYVDFDDEIELESGLSVARYFTEVGEASFRAMERRVGMRLLAEDRVVLGSGGGWVENVGGLAGLAPETASVWLRVTPEVALERVLAEPGRRPLLDVDDPLAEARRLAARREGGYATARWTVDTDGSSVDDVTAEVLRILASEYSDVGLNER